MIVMKQKTLRRSFSISGTGLHTGAVSKVTLQPAPVGHGIKFKVQANQAEKLIPADVTKVTSTERSTTLSVGELEIQTIEHLLAALYTSKLTNVLIEVEGQEIPILDGSSDTWVSAIESNGIEEQAGEVEVLSLDKTIHYVDPDTGAVYTAIPSSTMEISVTIDFKSKVVAPQHAELSSLDLFGQEIASCRTFVFLKDVLNLHKAGLIKGGKLDNAIIIADQVPSEAERKSLKEAFPDVKLALDQPGVYAAGGLKFSNEMARHKLLDVIGDLSLTGQYFNARIYVHRPSHKSNTAFAKVLKDYFKEMQKNKNVPAYDPNQAPIYDTLKIQEVLPHRYPFLLVDKIIELNDKFVVGIKNVTSNEAYFQGHFPGNPVMPGVLQIEALAQTGGILAISLMPDEFDYDTYFLKIDNAKFKAKVLPGDTLIFKMELLEPIRRGICIMQGTAYVGNKLVSEAVLTAQLVGKPKQN